MKWAGWFLLCCLNPIAQGAPLSLAAPVEYISLLRPFYEEWFGKAKVDFTFIPCTLARCRKLVDSDSTIDGDIARIKGFEQTHPQMLPVGTAIGEITIYAQSKQDASWPPASQERVGCLRGIQWCNRYLDSRRIVWFNDEKQGLALLQRGRTDWVIRLLPTNQSPPCRAMETGLRYRGLSLPQQEPPGRYCRPCPIPTAADSERPLAADAGALLLGPADPRPLIRAPPNKPPKTVFYTIFFCQQNLNGQFKTRSCPLATLPPSFIAFRSLKTMMLHLTKSSLALVLLAASGALSAAEITNNNITEADIKAAQDAWGAALIKISDDYRAGGIERAKATAEAVLDSAYGYQQGPVLFKPTLAGGEQTFRTTREGGAGLFCRQQQRLSGRQRLCPEKLAELPL